MLKDSFVGDNSRTCMVSLTYCHSVLDCCFISGFSGKRVGGGKGGGERRGGEREGGKACHLSV